MMHSDPEATADPFAEVSGDPFAQQGSLEGEDPAAVQDQPADPPYQPARDTEQGSLEGENPDQAEAEAEAEQQPEEQQPEAPEAEPEQPEAAAEVEAAPAEAPAAEEQPAEAEATPRRRRRRAAAPTPAEGDSKTPVRTYVVFEQGVLEDDRPYYFEVTQVLARNSTHALRTAFRKVYGGDEIGTEKTLVVVPESYWRPTPVRTYQPRSNVAVSIG